MAPSTMGIGGGPARLFILRPVTTILLMVALLFAGVLSYFMLPVSALPETEYPTIQIITRYPGASAEVIAAVITAPLEHNLGSIAGLKQISSQNSNGASVITLQFQLDLSMDSAEQEVQAAINATTTLLPSDLPTPPTYSKMNPADAPIITLAVTSSSLPLTKIQDLVETRVVQKLAQVAGVGLVTSSVGQRPAVRIAMNAAAMAALNISSEDIRLTINNANLNSAKGNLQGPARAYSLSSNDQLTSVASYRDLIIRYQNGTPIRLRDVATISEGAENRWLGSWLNEQQAIILNVYRQPSANMIATVDEIHQRLATINEALPGSATIKVVFDRTGTIRASIKGTQGEMLLAIVLVIAIIYLFLNSSRATLIPVVAVPLSLIGTSIALYGFHFSINNLTLMALTIATGFVVDDAIVVIENIARHIEQGETPLLAALKGAKEIGFTIISLTFSLIAVLIPLFFMSDIVGRLFREFAITLAMAILISAVVSLTLTPMMCARLLSPAGEQQPNRLMRYFDALFARLVMAYQRALSCVLNYPRTTLVVTLASLLITMVLWANIAKGFFPIQDNGLIEGTLIAPQSVSWAAMVKQADEVSQRLLTDPQVDSITRFLRVDGSNSALNTARLQIYLKAPAQRREALAVTQARLQRAVATIPGVTLWLRPVQDLTIETQAGRTSYQFTVQAPTVTALAAWIPQFTQRLQQAQALRDVSNDWQDGGLAAWVKVNRDSASRLGISMADVESTLYSAFGQRLISTIYTQSSQYRVILELDQHQQSGLAALQNIYLANGKVPLSEIATIEQRPTLLNLNRLDQLPAVTFFFEAAPGYSLEQAIAAITHIEQDAEMPPEMRIHFQGSTLAFKATLTSTLWLILAAVVVMYIVLGILYESFIHPLTILSTLPSATLGALIALILFNHALDVIAIIGIILLIGIVKKNAIMMIDFALVAEREQKMAPREAIYQACLLRLRPILMTTFAALFAALPLMFSSGVGAELRQPLGIVMVGGLIVSQIMTLFTTPVIYLTFDKLGRVMRRRSVMTDREAQP